MKRHLPFLLIAASLAAILSVLTVATWRTWTLDRDALVQQRSRAEEVAQKLDASLALSRQIASSTALLVESMRDPRELETLLTRLLRSTSPGFVYGIGVWFEPYRFDPRRRLFGPYVHRDDDRAPVLTYEWSTPAYDYPSHPWYVLGKASGERVAFSEPYFDTDYVYMTTTRAFFDPEGVMTGVVSVDLILPQLRSLIARSNVSPKETVFVTTGAGALFAHPDEKQLLAWARGRGMQPQSLLDLHEDDLRRFEAERKHSRDRVEVRVPVAHTGWQVHVATDRARLFAAGLRSRRIAIGVGVLAWGLFVAGFAAYLRWQEAEALARTVGAQRDTLRMRDEFLVLASHELKTPLTPLRARLQLIQRHVNRGQPIDPAELHMALASTTHLSEMINDLLDASRVGTGRLTLCLEPLQLEPLVREGVDDFARALSSHPVTFLVPDEPLWCLGDRLRLRQVLTNLLDNAIKYSPPGGPIAVELTRAGEEAILSVRDRGIGIPKDQQPHLFERYFRARNAPASSYGGLGLGLYVCREIVVGHGGRIWVQSREGAGSTLLVALPLI